MSELNSSWLTETDVAALQKFAENVEAGVTYPKGDKPDIRRLEEIGVVRHAGFGNYQLTAFGLYILGWETSCPLKTVAEHIAAQ